MGVRKYSFTELAEMKEAAERLWRPTIKELIKRGLSLEKQVDELVKLGFFDEIPSGLKH